MRQILGRRGGFANERGGASGRFVDHAQLRLERRIFPVLEQQSVGIALDDGENVIEFMHDRPRHLPGGVEFAGGFMKPAVNGSVLDIDTFDGKRAGLGTWHESSGWNIPAQFTMS